MPEPTSEAPLRRAFSLLDHEAIRRLARGAEGNAPDDFARIAFAFSHLVAGEHEPADALLNAVSGDGTASPADFAYVRAFRLELADDHEAVVGLLRHHLDDPKATHGARMRLRVADALLKLRRFAELREVLAPLLQPPGVDQTLEAQFIVLEAMLASAAPKETLIEQMALIDLLIERGFRLSEAGNVVYYAHLMDTHRIEPAIAPLFNAHEGLVDVYTTDMPSDIEFLAIAGEKYKVPAAVRCAARSYLRHPYTMKDLDPDRVAYLFAAHEQHDAARTLILACHSKAQITRDQNLWGPLILMSYHSGKWKETLDLLREHRAEITKLPLADNSRMIRAVCEYQLGRFAEALATIQSLGDAFCREARGIEAASEPFALLALDRIADLETAARRALAIRKDDQEFIAEYVTRILTEIMIRENYPAFRAWLKFLASVFRDEARAMDTQRIGEVAVEWAMPEAGRLAALELYAMDETVRATLLRALAEAEEGQADAAISMLTGLIENPGPLEREAVLLYRARIARRHGRPGDALRDCETVIASTFPRRHLAMAVKLGVYTEQGRPEEALAALDQELGKLIGSLAPSREAHSIMMFESRQFARGDGPQALLDSAKNAATGEPDSIEVLRLARRAARSAPTDSPVRREAQALESNWIEKFLLKW